MQVYANSDVMGQVLSSTCPSRILLEHLANKWSILVLHCLTEGVHRFKDLRVRIEGVSEKMLAQTLKILEQDGLLLRTVYPEVPPRVEYQLTMMGAQVAEKVKVLLDWLERNKVEIQANRSIDATTQD